MDPLMVSILIINANSASSCQMLRVLLARVHFTDLCGGEKAFIS